MTPSISIFLSLAAPTIVFATPSPCYVNNHQPLFQFPSARPPEKDSFKCISSELFGPRKETTKPVDGRRRDVLFGFGSLSIAASSLGVPQEAHAKCTDIESCREEGERKIEADLKRNPIVRLSNGVRYRVLKPSSSSGPTVTDGSSVDLIYSISTASGQYMYSKGFGFEKIESFGGAQQSDLGIDSLRVKVGKRNVPAGIESALIGMGKGERRRVELPPGVEVGFESSNWQPEPTTRRGKVQMTQYKRKLEGFGSQPPFPAETVWDIEVLSLKN